MGEGMNRWTGMGHLAADPVLRFTQSGTGVINLRMACNERFKNKDEEWEDRTEWVNVVVWGKRAEALSKILEKGALVIVEGRLQTTSYDKDGVKVWKTEVVADKVLLGGRAPGGSNDERDDRGGRDARNDGRSNGGDRVRDDHRSDRPAPRGDGRRDDRRDQRREPERGRSAPPPRGAPRDDPGYAPSHSDDDIPF